MKTIKLSQSKYNNLVIENKKDIERFTNRLKQKIQIKEVYGYEEKGEEIEKYERLLNLSLETKKNIENGKFEII